MAVSKCSDRLELKNMLLPGGKRLELLSRASETTTASTTYQQTGLNLSPPKGSSAAMDVAI